ncbi:hypothetical protein [Jeotgalibacillus sp. JSM ZJ347]|uniref:hypothetical protein n=1 Tax=Jeotgalibacillus sp. JSM ZJ347 TaxID=3342117 RepID=UPI0035A9A91F
MKWILFICSAVVAIIFYIVNQMTVSPGTSSGNGNPAMLVGWVLIPVLIMMVLTWLKVIRMRALSKKFTIAGISFIALHLIVGIIYQRIALDGYRNVIRKALIERDGTVDESYLTSITSGLTIHVNSQYFNVNTYLMFITASLLIALVWHVWDLIDKGKEI